MAVAVEIPTKPDPLLLNVPAAACLLGITTWQLRGLIAAKEIPVVKIGRKLFVRKVTLVRFTEREEHAHRVGA